MDKKLNIVPLKDLNLTDRFLFDEVMEDKQTHRDVLEIIFQREIPLLEENGTEKELRVSPLSRSIRMDVFAMDEEDTLSEQGHTWLKRLNFAPCCVTFNQRTARYASFKCLAGHKIYRFSTLRPQP